MGVQTYNAKIAKIVQETSLSKTFTLELGGKEIDFLPGQFVMIEFMHKLPNTRRAYSISSSPLQKKAVSITLKKEGLFTGEMDAAKIGEEMLVKGPIGHFVLDETVKSDIVFIAGGTGVAPFRSMIYYVLEKNMQNKMTLFYSCKTPEEFIFYRELNELQAIRSQFSALFTATRCQDSSWNGFCERINPEMIKRTIANYKERLYYLCGPKEMVASLQTMFEGMGIDKKMIKVEKWG